MDSHTSSKLWNAIKSIHYLLPPTIFLYFLVTSVYSVYTLQTLNPATKTRHIRRDILLALVFFVGISYILEALTIGVYDLIHKTWSGAQDHNIYVLASALVWSIPIRNLFETQFPVWYPYIGCWVLGMGCEMFLVIVSNILQPPRIWLEFVSTIISILRICAFVTILCLYVILRIKQRRDVRDPERQPLLNNKPDTNDHVTESDPTEEEDEDDKKDRERREKLAERLNQEGNWWTYLKGFSLFFPLVFPVSNRKLQARAFGVGICLGLKNVMNILVPIQFGIASASLLKSGTSSQGPWVAVSIYIVLRFILYTLLDHIKDVLWLPVYLYAIDTLRTTGYAHIMSLSSDFHSNKSSSEVIRALSDGHSVTDLAEKIIFEILPMFIDFSVAIVYLYFLFGPYMVIANCAMVLVYFYYTTYSIVIKTALRKKYLKDNRNENRLTNEGIRGWQTASYFNRIPYENQRYDQAVKTLHVSYIDYVMGIYDVGVIQSAILSLGWTLAMYIAVYHVVVTETSTVANFITLVSYWQRISGPLQFFSRLYKDISEKLLHAESLRELLQTKPSVVDAPNAVPIDCSKGCVVFNGVTFEYDSRKPVLTDISFRVPGGSTIAIVGETGGGKSTMLKLLSRFWDVKEGSIEIDGQDITQVTLSSLRDVIGSVPQDPVLFNDTIMNNVRYAKLDADDEEVHDACRGASVHDKILGFPDGYQAKVGDHGIKLSGGEKQRMAIARAILKNPRIILLDEATSAVDTETESHIQETFSTLCKDRTTFIVAHRLSTVMRADKILVLKDGTIVEEGSHKELIEKRGKYHDLWSKQTFYGPPEDSANPEAQSQSLEQFTEQEQCPKKIAKEVQGHEQCPSQAEISEQVVNQLPSPKKPETLTTKLPATSSTVKSGNTNQAKPVETSESPKLNADAAEFIPRVSGLTLDGADDFNELRKQERAFNGEGSASSMFQPNEIEVKEYQGKPLVNKSKKSRPARRNQSKSEPNPQLDQESIRRAMNGTSETEWTGSGSGEGSLPLLPSRSERRVSAPSDPPSGTLRDLRGASRGGRARRPKHWRFRKHSQDNGLSMSGSGSRSVDNSSTSTSTGVLAPTTTPADARARTPKIRFAPGC